MVKRTFFLVQCEAAEEDQSVWKAALIESPGGSNAAMLRQADRQTETIEPFETETSMVSTPGMLKTVDLPREQCLQIVNSAYGSSLPTADKSEALYSKSAQVLVFAIQSSAANPLSRPRTTPAPTVAPSTEGASNRMSRASSIPSRA